MAETLTTSGTASSDADHRALVVRDAPEHATARPRNYRSATFLAHLIAVRDRHPQMCDKRRIEPAQAAQVYRNALTARRPG